MAIRYANIAAGMTLYDRHRHGMGNTTMTELGEWPVRVLELLPGGAKVVWNGNAHRPEFYSIRRLERLYSWSMYDPNEAEIVKSSGLFSRVLRVRRLSAAERKARREATAGKVAP